MGVQEKASGAGGGSSVATGQTTTRVRPVLERDQPVSSTARTGLGGGREGQRDSIVFFSSLTSEGFGSVLSGL